MIDTAVLGGPKVFVVATLASQRPAAPYVMRNYELPFEAAPLAAQLRACDGSCRHHVWQVGRGGGGQGTPGVALCVMFPIVTRRIFGAAGVLAHHNIWQVQGQRC